MKLLALGDVVGQRAIALIERELWKIRQTRGIGFVVCNGENAAEIRGMRAVDGERLLAAGVDVITLGNHAFGQKDLYPVLEREKRIIRPVNFPPQTPGMGYTVAVAESGERVLCINVCGRAFMEAYASPFDTVEAVLKREAGTYDFAVLDIHAEATSEKYALARWFDGKIRVIFGTHTHVTTADEQILPHGTGYQSDLGMCGPVGGILGTDADAVIEKFRSLMPVRFTVAGGDVELHGTEFEILDGKVCKIERLTFPGGGQARFQ